MAEWQHGRWMEAAPVKVEVHEVRHRLLELSPSTTGHQNNTDSIQCDDHRRSV